MGYMAELQRKELLRLFGPEAMGLVTVDVPYWDPKVCRNFLNGMCPHGLFANTRSDMGPCPRLHTERLKEDYDVDVANNANTPHVQAIRSEFERNIIDFVSQCDARIRHEYRKLDATAEENNRATQLMRDIGDLDSAVTASMTEAEALGESGEVDASMKELEKMEALKAEKEEKEREFNHLRETAGAGGHQKLRVCDTCGARLSILDSDRRLADHFGGKMHLGYLEMRKMIDTFKDKPGPRNFVSGGGGGGGASANAMPLAGNGTNEDPLVAATLPNGEDGARSSAAPYPPSRQPGGPPTSGSRGMTTTTIMGGPQTFVPSRSSMDSTGREAPSGPRSDRDRIRSDRDRDWDRDRGGGGGGRERDDRRRYDSLSTSRDSSSRRDWDSDRHSSSRRRSRSPGR